MSDLTIYSITFLLLLFTYNLITYVTNIQSKINQLIKQFNNYKINLDNDMEKFKINLLKKLEKMENTNKLSNNNDYKKYSFEYIN